MKYFIEYYHPDIENNPYVGLYNVYFKRWWFSRKKPVVEGHLVEGGLAAIINTVVKKHIKSFHTCVAWSDINPEHKEVNL